MAAPPATPSSDSPKRMTVAVVLHYDRIPLTAECCRSLAAQDAPGFRVLVVDNASPSHSPDALRAALSPGTAVLRTATNLGFGGGMNAGIREALRDPGVDSLLLLNNDTRCPPRLVSAMRETLASDPAVGLVGCDMEGAGGGDSAPAGYRLGRGFGYPRPCRPGEAPDYLQASCLLVPRDVAEATGGFDDDFRFFFEDADFSLMVRAMGRRLAVVPGVRIFHYGSATIGRDSARKAEFFRHGHRLFLRKWRSLPRLRAAIPFCAALAVDALTGRFQAVRGSLKGWNKPISGVRRKDLPRS